VVAAVVLIRALVPRLRFDTLIESARFVLTAPVLAPLPAAMLVAATLSTTTGGDFRSMFETWWFGHAVGFAVAIPFGVTMARLDLKAALKPERIAEAALVLGGLAGVAGMVFVQDTKPVSFLITPLMLLAALRLRVPGAAAAVLIVAVIAIIGTLTGGGPMDVMRASIDEKVRLAQLYVLFGCLPALLVASVLDERDQMAEAARQGQAKAEAASAGKSRLLANVSHEIKSPISGVIGIGEMWATGKLGEVTPRQAEMATMLVSTARQIEVLAYDLLNVAKAESGSVSVQIRPVNLEAVVEDVKREAELSPDAAGLRFSIDREPGVEFVAMADSVRIAQVFRNLTTNAVKYGASGGVVIFRLSQPQPDKVRVAVVDRGPGLKPERVEELFEPFNRLGMERSQVEGHGIGLALAKRLTELQGGAIGVETSPGAGACFWVELPVAT
jgi:signal transduction histidine kinase